MKVYKCTPEDALYVASRMRKVDMVEVERMSGRAPVKAVMETFDESDFAWVGLIEDEPVFIFGVIRSSIMLNSGIPWMVATDKLPQRKKEFMKISFEYIEKIRSVYSVLENYVDVENTVSINWLKKIGFTIHDPEPIGLNGALFHRFDWRRDNV